MPFPHRPLPNHGGPVPQVTVSNTLSLNSGAGAGAAPTAGAASATPADPHRPRSAVNQPSTPAVSLPPVPPGSARASGALPKLGPGQLRDQVREILDRYPHLDWSAGQIARRLGGRSSGAVGQALDRLVELGHAERTSPTSRHYRASRARPAAPAARPAPARGQAPVPAPTTTGPVTRPNGQRYHPRLLAGQSDVDVLRRLRAADVPVLLYGPPGTGKTSLIEAAFTDLYTVAGDADTTVGDLVGDWVPAPGGGYTFVEGPLVTAMREGACLFLDDATLISPTVLAAVYPAMDGRRQIRVKANGGQIVAAEPGFYVVAGHNPGVHGAVLTEALSSRFAAQIRVSTDYDLALGLGVNPQMVRAARQLSTQQENGEISWAPQLRELLAFARMDQLLGVETALANLVGLAPEEDRDQVAAALAHHFRVATPTPLALGRQR